MTEMETARIQPFGHVVSVGPVQDLDPTAKEELRRLYHDQGLLVLRGQRLSHAEQIAFCRIFGPVHESPFENFIVSNVDSEGHLGQRELLWHNDTPFLPSPYLAGCLHALSVTPDAVGTRFVSAVQGFERLPAALRERIAGMKALQVRERVLDRPTRLTDLKAGDICTVHDMVRTDPATGQRYLFVNQAWTAQVIGLSQEEGDALLAEVFACFYEADEIYEHRWQDGDMVLWDNLRVQHARGAAGSGTRTLQRVTITDLGYAQQYPTDVAIYSELHNDTMLAAPPA